MSVLSRIQTSSAVTDGGETIPLRGAISAIEGAYLQQVIATHKPRRSLEIGLAYGVSALYICEAMAALSADFEHVVVDPMQKELWRDIGLRHLREAGFERNVRFHRSGSELVLPELLKAGEAFDLAFIDGFHTFDHCMVDVFYATRLLNVGGVLVLDDANWPSINKLIGYVEKYPCYRRLPGPRGGGLVGKLSRMRPLDVPKAVLKRLQKHGVGGSSIAKASVAAFQKVAKDERPSDWFTSF